MGLARRATGVTAAPRAATAGPLGPHSLLIDEADTGGRSRNRGEFVGIGRSSRRNGRHGSEYQEWLSSIEDMIGTGAGQLLEQVFGNIQGGAAHGAPPPIPAGGIGGAGAILQNLLSSMGNRASHSSRHRHSVHQSRTENATSSELQVVNETISNPSWIPTSTTERWTEAAATFNGGIAPSERITLYSKRVSAVLMPEKRRRQKEQDEKDAKEKEERIKAMEEQAAKNAEEQAKKDREEAEAAAQVPADEPGSQEQPAAESTMETDAVPGPAPETPAQPVSAPSTSTSERPNWRERVARRRQEQAAAAAQQSTSPPAASANEELARVLALANNFRTSAALPPAEESNSLSEGPAPASAAMETQQAVAESQSQDTEMAGGQAAEEDMHIDEEQSQDAAPEAGPSEPAGPTERVTIQIRGNAVDITDTGIDPTFLEALPDDMREECVPVSCSVIES